MWRVVALLSLCLSANALLVSPAVRPKPIFAQRTKAPILGENSQTRGFRSVDNLVGYFVELCRRASSRFRAKTSMVEAAAEPRRWSPPICWLGIFYILFMIGLLCFTYYQFTLPWPEGHPQRNPDGSWKIRVDGREL